MNSMTDNRTNTPWCLDTRSCALSNSHPCISLYFYTIKYCQCVQLKSEEFRLPKLQCPSSVTDVRPVLIKFNSGNSSKKKYNLNSFSNYRIEMNKHLSLHHKKLLSSRDSKIVSEITKYVTGKKDWGADFPDGGSSRLSLQGIPGQYLQLRHDCFLRHPFQFIICYHPVIPRYTQCYWQHIVT
jgi:hypothetical protein